MSFSMSRVQWALAAPLLKNVREKVFVCEWRIPPKIEFDGDDQQAIHILVCDDNKQEPVATGRIMPTGEISRVAVLKNYRKQELDKLVFQALIRIARELTLDEIYIYVPLSRVDYFMQNNFHIDGSVYMEAGIPRQRMVCPIHNISNGKYYLSH